MTPAALTPDVTHTPTPVQSSHREKQVEALRMLGEGASTREVGRALGMSHVTVWRLAREIADVDETARKYLAAKALRAVDAWSDSLDVAARKGDHRPAKDLLLHARVIDPVEPAGSSHVGVQVVIGMPGAPAGPDPLGAKVASITHVEAPVNGVNPLDPMS